jgi:hypothetical protein
MCRFARLAPPCAALRMALRPPTIAEATCTCTLCLPPASVPSQTDEWRRTLDEQRASHQAELATVHAAHANATAALTAQLEESAKEQTEAAVRRAEAKFEKERGRMQSEIDSYRNYSSTANYALQSNTKALREAQEREREATAERHRKQNEQLVKQTKALEEEIERLRRVQSQVLETSQALPGGEARQYLFFEAAKTRKLLSGPETTISWRGVHEEPHLPSSAGVAASPFAPSAVDRIAAARARRAAAQETRSPPRARGATPSEPARRPVRPESARQPRRATRVGY